MALDDDQKRLVLAALTGQALADHLGDVRDAERHLWELLDAPDLPATDPAWDTDSAYRVMKARAKAAGLEHLLPEYAQRPDDDE